MSFATRGIARETTTRTQVTRALELDRRILANLFHAPIGHAGGINLYAYVGNNPLRWVDPLGWGAAQGSGFGNTLTPIAQIEAQGIQVAGGNDYIDAETLTRLHGLAKNTNASASLVVGAGIGKAAGFGALSVAANGNITLDLGLGVGAGTLKAISITGMAEVQGGQVGPVRLEFIAGGAIGGGALQRSSVSLTSPGAAAGGGFLGGLGGFVFIGPTVAIPLGNVSDFGDP